MKLLLAGIVIGFLIALGGDVLAQRDESPQQGPPAAKAAPATTVSLSAGPVRARRTAAVKP